MASRHEAWEELCLSKVGQHTYTSAHALHCVPCRTRAGLFLKEQAFVLCGQTGCREGLLHGVGTQNCACMVAYALVTLLYVAWRVGVQEQALYNCLCRPSNQGPGQHSFNTSTCSPA